jgi:hypothetical protein
VAKHGPTGGPPRYSFLLNPHLGTRLSRCPICERLTHPRKFALLIHVEGYDPLALGKTARYCTPCELVMVHQDELEAELANNLGRIAPHVVGNPYIVLGTVDIKVWRRGLAGGQTAGEAMEAFAPFEKYYDLEFDPGGWRPA